MRCAHMKASGVPSSVIVQLNQANISKAVSEEVLVARVMAALEKAEVQQNNAAGLMSAQVLRDELQGIKAAIVKGNAPNAPPSTTTITNTPSIVSSTTFTWEGSRYRRLPFGFTFPSVIVQQAHEMWWLGFKDIGPLRHVVSSHDISLPKQRKVYSTWKTLMTAMYDHACDELEWLSSVGQPTHAQVREMYTAGADVIDDAYHTLDMGKYTTVVRGVTVSTASRNFSKAKQHKKTLEDDEGSE